MRCKFLKKMKDGGSESTVVGYWLVEIKSLFSICVLNFQGKSREAYHTHAFNAVSWLLKGQLNETMIDGSVRTYKPSLKPIITPRSDFHKVDSDSGSWVLTFRGPWVDKWKEFHPETDRHITLTHGRKQIDE